MCIFVVIGLVAPTTLLLASAHRFTFGAAFCVELVVVMHSAAGLSYVFTSRNIHIVQFTFWSFTYVWLGLAGMVQVSAGVYPWPSSINDHFAFFAALMIELGMVAYTIGLVLARRRGEGTMPDWCYRLGERKFVPSKVLILAGISVLVTLVFVPRLGGLGTFFSSREAASDAAKAATGSTSAGAEVGLLNWGTSILPFWALVALILTPFPKSLDRLRPVAIIVLIPINVIVNNPISQPRFWAGTVFLTLLICIKFLRKVNSFRVLAGVLLFTLAVVFPYSDYFRYADATTTQSKPATEQLITNPDFDAFQQVASGVALVEVAGIQPRMALGPVMFWLPRSVWEGKPEPAGAVIGEFVGYDFLNISAPMWIETYLWGGALTLLIAFLLGGIITERLDQTWRYASRLTASMAMPLIASVAFFQLVFLRGALLAMMGPLFLLIVIPFAISRTPQDEKSAMNPARNEGDGIHEPI